jgi:Iron-containing redox enzyme
VTSEQWMDESAYDDDESFGEVGNDQNDSSLTYRRAAFEWPLLPWPRGPLSEFVVSALQRQPGTLGVTPTVTGVDALRDDDFGLALYLCYEVHYRNLTEADWEWDPGMLEFRGQLEREFVSRLREEIGHVNPGSTCQAVDALDELIRRSPGPSLSLYLHNSGTLDQFRELCVHHSATHLREADPLSFGIPRLKGPAKAAMAEIQYDELGCGDAAHMHSTMFADTMVALGLDSSYGSYVENLPGVTLAMVNLTSMFALQRRWRAALVGHLAASEMTSGEPMYRYSQVLARFGVSPEGRRFYDVHANIDARHAMIARDRLVAGLIGTEPHLEEDLLFGAAALLMLRERFERYLLDAWSKKRTSLVPWEMSTT